MTAEPVALRVPAGAPLRAPVPLDGRTLTPAAVAAIAHGGAGVLLTGAARARNAASRAALERAMPGEGQNAVIAPVPASRKIRERHEFDCGDSCSDKVIEL